MKYQTEHQVMNSDIRDCCECGEEFYAFPGDYYCSDCAWELTHSDGGSDD